MFDRTTEPGPGTAALLASVDLAACGDAELLDAAVAAYRQVAWTQAAMFAALAELHRRFRAEEPASATREPLLDVATELAPAAGIAPGTANGLVDLAVELTERLPRTLDAMRRGDVDAVKAKVVAEVTGQLSAEARQRVEQVALEHAPRKSARQLRRTLADAAIRVDPEAAERRREAACRRRRVEHWAEPDGQAAVHAVGPAEKTMAVYSVLDRLARRQRAEGDTRSVDERRFDALYDLVVGGSHVAGGSPAAPTSHDRVAGELQVVVAVDTLMGLDERPGLLRGYGPITSEAARAFARDARWRRLLTDAMDGSLLDVGTTTYRPPEHLRRFITIRDQTCLEPTCDHDAGGCQLDHTENFPHGPTAEGNLGAWCVRGHQTKTRGGVTVEQVEPGVFHYTTRLGRRYVVDRRPLLGLTGPDDGSIDPGTGQPDLRTMRLGPPGRHTLDPGDPPF